MATSVSTAYIPVIDLRAFINGSDAQQQAIAQQIYAACRNVGFFYLTHHSLSSALLNQLFEQSQQFFALNNTAKQQLAWSAAESNRGYVGIAREALDPSRPGDFKEAFNIGRESGREDLSAASSPSHEFNRWPAKLPQFRETALHFYDACTQLANTVLIAMAIALQLPRDFFTARHNQHHHTLRLLHYPPLPPALLPNQTRAGAHSDYGSLTLLFQDHNGGLEIQTVDGTWIAAAPISDTVLVNLGDLMERWTNHVFRSTKHRVSLPDEARSHQSRYSIAFFCEPNPDVEVACLESCQDSNHPPLYPPTTAGEYLLECLQKTY